LVGEGETGGGVVVVAAGLGVGLGFALTFATVGVAVGDVLGVTIAAVGVITGRLGGGAAELADAADADCCATCALTNCWVVTKSWLPLTSRPTRSTAVRVTAVITTHESNHPRARVSGRPAPRRPPSARMRADRNRVRKPARRGDSFGFESRRGGSN
jgi:hypothetical protein